jgi:hypothetical protein
MYLAIALALVLIILTFLPDMLRKAVPGVGLYVMERGTIREEE